MSKGNLNVTWVCVAMFLLFLPYDIFSQNGVQKDTVYVIDEFVVTGSNSETGRNHLPYSVSVMNSADIEATGQSQLLSAVSGRMPSVFVTERNVMGFGVSTGGSGAIKIRGVGGQPTSQVLMLVDGQPQFAGIFSHHVADAYDAEYVERVEVLRGPASVLYGSNAMGGVINVITKDAGKEGVRTCVSSQYGSFNTWRTNITNTVKKNKFSSLFSAGYDRTDGTEKDFDFKQGNLYAKLGYDFSKNWNVRSDFTLVKFVGNDPIYPKFANPESDDVYHQNITRGEASVSANNKYGKTDGCVRLYYNYGIHNLDNPKHFHSTDDRFGFVAYQNAKLWSGGDATFGFDFDSYSGEIAMSGGKGRDEAPLATLDRERTTEYSPYIIFSQKFLKDKLFINGGLRMANSDRFSTQWIPQGGVSLLPHKKITVKASVAKGYRNPSFKELYLFATANPNLEPENMLNYELSYIHRFSRYFNIDLTAYYSEGSNIIQTVKGKNQNTGEFVNKGFEFSAYSMPTDKLSLRASYSFLATNLEKLTGAPESQVFVGANWKIHPKFSVNADLKAIGGLYVSDAAKSEDYLLFNLKVSYLPKKFIEVFCSLDNLTNEKYTINEGYEMPGFTCMGGFKLTF